MKQYDKMFVIQKSNAQPNGWVLTDKKHGIVVMFEDGCFNDTQHVTLLDDVERTITQKELSSYMRALGEWAVRYHSSKCFSSPYGLEYSEDDEALYLYRRKYPRWRMKLEDKIDANKLAQTLTKAAEWLRKGKKYENNT